MNTTAIEPSPFKFPNLTTCEPKLERFILAIFCAALPLFNVEVRGSLFLGLAKEGAAQIRARIKAINLIFGRTVNI